MKNLNDLTAVMDKLTPLERQQVEAAKSSYMLHVAMVTSDYVKQKEEYENLELLAGDDPLTRTTLNLLRDQIIELENKVSQLACELESHFNISA